MSTKNMKISLLTVTLLSGLGGDAARAQDLRPGSSCVYGRVHGLVAGEVRLPKRDFRPIRGAVLTFRNCGTGEEHEFETVIVQADRGDQGDAAPLVAGPPSTDPAEKPPVLECRRLPSNYWTSDIPVGIYQVTIRHPLYQTYQHPRRIVVRARDRSLRVDFLRMVLRRDVLDASAASE